MAEDASVRETFEKGKIFFATLASASEVLVQSDKNGIADDAVSAVIPQAVIYIPFAELVDIEKEIQRLEKEEGRLEKELARVNGMLSNERFISKAPQAKIDEEKGKLEKYTQMMEQVKEDWHSCGKYASNESKSMQLHETPVIAAISVRNM